MRQRQFYTFWFRDTWYWKNSGGEVKNGAGKTTLLRTIAGELDTERDDKREGIGTSYSRNCVITMLKQQPFVDKSITVEAELLKACPYSGTYAKERFEYELEYDKLFTGFGFSKIDKKKQISAFLVENRLR